MNYHGLQGQLYRYLQEEPKARERRAKDRALCNLLIRNYPALRNIPKETLIEVVRDFNALDRYWRLLTSLHPELRGSDYDTKQVVEERKQLQLGVAEMGFNHKIHA